MKLDKKSMLLYAVTDRAWTQNQTLTEQVRLALSGGVTCVQLREKDLDSDTFFSEASEIKALCRQYHVPFIINDDVELAIKCNADGIHVGQHDMSLPDVRKLAGDNMIIGVSAQTVEQALAAESGGADYLGVGAVFSTSTKPDADQVSHSMLKQICQAVSIPVVAIGGIDKHNIMKLSGLGVDGIALVSAIFSAQDIESECKELRRITEKMINSI